MIIRNLNEVKNSPYNVKTDKWESIRLIRKCDQMGFSFHITTMYAETITEMCYTNHLESAYCLEGIGEIEDINSGDVYRISPGMIYILNDHDRHIVRAETDITIACVFNPGLVGDETHLPDGSYRI